MYHTPVLPPAGAVSHTGNVGEFCTCGAELPPDARFCHKCGKPQREEPVFEEVAAPPPPSSFVPAAAIAHRIDFHNGMAVRVAFFSALLASFFNVLALPASPLWLAASAFLCVWLYMRRAGESLTVRAGARMGWIMGLFSFVILTVVVTIGFVGVVNSGEFQKMMNEQFSNMALPETATARMTEMMQSPGVLAITLLLSLFILFVISIAFSVAGGALGAKLLHKD
jgi:hypothetical protein